MTCSTTIKIIQKGSRKWFKNELKWTPKRPKMGPWSEFVCCFFSRIEFGNNMVQNDSILISNLTLKIDEKSTYFLMHFLEPSQSGIVTISAAKTTSKVVPFRHQFHMWRPCDFAAIYYTLERFWRFSCSRFSHFFLNVFQACSGAWKSPFLVDFEVPFATILGHCFACDF